MSGGWTWTKAVGVEHDEAHVAEQLAQTLDQDREKPRIQALDTILATRWQTVEDLLWQLATERDLDNAVGVQLDGLGDVLDEGRGGLSDDQYRLFLRAKVLTLRSRGRVEQLLQILGVLGYTHMVIYEQPPAHMQIEVLDCPLALETDRVLREAKAGGVGLTFVYSQYSAAEVFRASGTYAASEIDSATGAGSVYDAATGGRSAGCFR